jgi:DNA-binding winged helix-turn-helix (wHTH) protein/tetratricopeptide (TPR) repeat protein
VAREILRFGPFELDRDAGELRKHGLRIHLQAQPLAILEFLLTRPAGTVVTRQDLREQLWPTGTHVDFERGLNSSIARLRAALGDSAETPRYLETLPGRGYRFLTPVSGLKPAAHSPSMPRLVVLPFYQLQPDEETSFLCFGLADAITSSLAGIPSLLVRSSRVAARFAGPTSQLAELAADADVDTALTGTLLRSAGQIRLSVQLLRVPAGAVLFTHTAQLPLGDLFWLQDELARRILESLVPSIADREKARDQRTIPATARAYEFYLRANRASTQMRDLELARDLYQCCLREDAAFAPAWARLARCHRILAKFRSSGADNLALAEDAFQRAFALQPNLAETHCLYSYLETEQGRAQDAVVRLLGQLRENPNDGEVLIALVSSCRYAGLLDVSLAAHQRARHLDRHARTSGMHTHFMRGEYQLAMETSTDDVGYFDAMALDALNRRAEALQRVQRREHLPPLMALWLRMLDAYLSGREEDAVSDLEEINRQGVDPEGYFYRARLFARLDRREKALASLESALKGGYYCAAAYSADPYLERLRDSPRFAAIEQEADLRSREARAKFETAGGCELLP